ncbi:hypothetical protein AXG89_14065 [Burkholderia sp. PAMC 26561]|nr:hypothetical protein AXG89_14065 [Burkholderia sp. PAMC 26561]
MGDAVVYAGSITRPELTKWATSWAPITTWITSATCRSARDLRKINAANLREAHRLLDERCAIGKMVTTGF